MKRSFLCVLAVCFVAIALPVQQAWAGSDDVHSYVLTAGNWGAKQDAAVFRAGGKVIFSHGRSGIGVVESASPDFAALALASKAFTTVAEDQVVQWQPPVNGSDVLEAAVTPGNETFINMQWNIKAVEAEGAWVAGFTGHGVRVAVIDGGIYDGHVDLVDRVDVAASRSFVFGKAFNEDTGTFWHATHVAGIIAASDNGIGTIGVAPEATIIGIKALHAGSGNFGAIIQALFYAVTPLAEGGAGADIVNMSLGAVVPKGGGHTGIATLCAALNKTINYAGRFALVVSSAGNDGLDLDHTGSLISIPAMSGSGIAVSATGPVGCAVGYPDGATNFRRPASYTNYGDSLVWLAAPGGDHVLEGNADCLVPRVPTGNSLNPCWVFDMVISCVRGPDSLYAYYGYSDGTSMAAPVVSAVAALVKQKYPFISVGELKTHLARTADDEGKPGHDPYYGRGFVNARRAVTE
jgi:subtilisin family serine protease